MNISHPFAPNVETLSDASMKAFANIWAIGHPSLPMKHQDQIKAVLMHMNNTLNDILLGDRTHLFKTFSGSQYDMFARLYGIFTDLFISYSNCRFMPRIVMFSDCHPEARRALKYLEQLKRVKVAIYYRLPFEPIDRERLRSLIVPNTVLVTVPLVNELGRRSTDDELSALDALCRDCYKTPLHVDVTYAISYITDGGNNPITTARFAPVVSCDFSHSHFPHTYSIGLHDEHIIKSPSYQSHVFGDLHENHCAVMGLFAQMQMAQMQTTQMQGTPKNLTALIDPDEFLTDIKLATPDAYITSLELMYQQGWPRGRRGLVIINDKSQMRVPSLTFAVRIGDRIIPAADIQQQMLYGEAKRRAPQPTYIQVVDARPHLRMPSPGLAVNRGSASYNADMFDSAEMQKIMANLCVVTHRSPLLQACLSRLLCDSSSAQLLDAP